MNVEDSLPTAVAGSEAVADRELAKVLESYLAAIEAGHAPNPDQVVAEHPLIADRLRACLASLSLLECEGELFQPAGLNHNGEAPDDGHDKRRLGDFRILREVGRGGMGVVYEAEQISLGRRVALKVLPFAATMDPRQLLRFQNEARSAASLEHPHIVPVYGVGCERGVHYYAMKFIDGQTVAKVIADLRSQIADLKKDSRSEAAAPNATPASGSQSAICNLQSAMAATSPVAALPTQSLPRDAAYFRRAAEWGIQAAEALEYAHEMGIVHRDIKPANLLVQGEPGASATGVRLWITDFGLARVQADAGITMTGDVLGTLRYMSPEQALAKHGLVDHRTDIYSLGATLYEWLTLQPAVDGKNREEILKRITFEEPRPLRSLNREIPTDLETIVQKAMAKEVGERYATARELAEDLRRFLEDKPIQARRPTLVQRTMKWVWRNRTFVKAACFGLGIAVIALAATTMFALEKEAQTKEAFLGEQTALQQSRANEQEAKKQQQRADDNFRRAIEEVAGQLEEINQNRYAGSPQLAEARNALAERALKFLQPLVDQNRTDPEGRFQAGLAYQGMAQAQFARGQYAHGVDASATALELFKAMVADFPQERVYEQKLNSAKEKMVEHLNIVLSIGDDAGLDAIEFQEKVLTYSQRYAADLHLNYQTECRVGLCANNVARFYAWSNAPRAEQASVRAVVIWGKLSSADPNIIDVTYCMIQLADVQLIRGLIRAEAGQTAEAEADYRQALALIDKLTPKDRAFWIAEVLAVDPALIEAQLGNLLWVRREHDEARQLFRKAEQEWRGHRSTPPRNNRLAWFLATCPDENFRNAKEAVELAKDAAKSKAPSLHYEFRDFRTTLGVAYYRAGDWQAAIDALKEAIKVRQGGNAIEWFLLAMANWRLDKKEDARTWYDKAVQWMENNRPKDGELRRFRAEAKGLLGIKESPPPKEKENP